MMAVANPAAAVVGEGQEWQMYYDEHGYPYYHNAVSGESVWAEPKGEEAVHPSPPGLMFESTRKGAPTEEMSKVPLETGEAWVWDHQAEGEYVDEFVNDDNFQDTDEDSDTDSDVDDDSDDDDDDDDDEDDEEDEDSELEETFRAMLATPEGQAALHAEVDRTEETTTKRKRYEKWLQRQEKRLPSLLASLLTAPIRLVLRGILQGFHLVCTSLRQREDNIATCEVPLLPPEENDSSV